MDTHSYYDEIQPTPRVGEIFRKTISRPFDQHFKDKDYGKNLVHNL